MGDKITQKQQKMLRLSDFFWLSLVWCVLCVLWCCAYAVMWAVPMVNAQTSPCECKFWGWRVIVGDEMFQCNSQCGINKIIWARETRIVCVSHTHTHTHALQEWKLSEFPSTNNNAQCAWPDRETPFLHREMWTENHLNNYLMALFVHNLLHLNTSFVRNRAEYGSSRL